MPELTIQLRCDPVTGKRDIVVKLHEDGELLPAEHERMHRTLVEKLLRAGVLKEGEAGNLVIEREAGASRLEDVRRARILIEERLGRNA